MPKLVNNKREFCMQQKTSSDIRPPREIQLPKKLNPVSLITSISDKGVVSTCFSLSAGISGCHSTKLPLKVFSLKNLSNLLRVNQCAIGFFVDPLTPRFRTKVFLGSR